MSLKSLQAEIGWVGFGVIQVKEIPFFGAWTRLLAGHVANYAVRDDQPHYPAIVAAAKEIAAANNTSLPLTCKDILNPPIRIECTLALDPAVVALQAVCMSGKNGIIDRNRTRWPAEASQVVWALLVGNGSVNECQATITSRAAWQRQLFDQAVALVNHGKGGTNG